MVKPDVTVDQLEQVESDVFKEFQRVYGSLTVLSSDVMSVQKELARAFMLNEAEQFSNHQVLSFLWLLSSLTHQVLMSSLCIMRGHPTDASTFTRKAIEITAFMVEILADAESAKRWMEIGTSQAAKDRYTSRFPAWKVVQKHLKERDAMLTEQYEEYCLMVHPGLASLSQQAEFEAGTITFNHIEFSHQGHLDHLVTQYLLAITMHLRMCNVLAQVCEEHKFIVAAGYHKRYDSVAQKVQTANHQFVAALKARSEKPSS